MASAKRSIRNLSTPESRAFWAGVARTAWQAIPITERLATWLETPGAEKWTESETRIRFAIADKIRSGEWFDEAWALEAAKREVETHPPPLPPPWGALDDDED